MTPKQLERKIRQLHCRRRLAGMIEELEETIKSFMAVEGKKEIHTEDFIIRLVEGTLDIAINPKYDPNQLTLNFAKKHKT
jgi:hypothetical protein